MKKDAIRLLNAVKDYQSTGDESRFEETLELLMPLMSSLTKGDSPRWREDLIQEMSLGIWKAVRSFRVNGKDEEADAAMLLVAVRKAAASRRINFLKSRYVRETESSLSLELQVAENAEATENQMALGNSGNLSYEAGVKAVSLEKAVSFLSERDRSFLKGLLDIGGNLSEYARRAGTSRQAAAKKLARIKKRVKKIIAEGCQS